MGLSCQTSPVGLVGAREPAGVRQSSALGPRCAGLQHPRVAAGPAGGHGDPAGDPHPRFSAPICWPESWGCAWSVWDGGRVAIPRLRGRLVSAPVPISLSKAGRCDISSREFFPSPQTCPFRVTWLKTDWFEEGHNL